MAEVLLNKQNGGVVVVQEPTTGAVTLWPWRGKRKHGETYLLDQGEKYLPPIGLCRHVLIP